MRPGGGFALKKINDPGLILGTKEYSQEDHTYLIAASLVFVRQKKRLFPENLGYHNIYTGQIDSNEIPQMKIRND